MPIPFERAMTINGHRSAVRHIRIACDCKWKWDNHSTKTRCEGMSQITSTAFHRLATATTSATSKADLRRSISIALPRAWAFGRCCQVSIMIFSPGQVQKIANLFEVNGIVGRLLGRLRFDLAFLLRIANRRIEIFTVL
ncbi:hypothetical protein [Novipirellula caenicola]|uniref:hypothetical protein n=1 Tax=Novipirellula caenicola TaxID=1536901 RepID=UPI0031EF13DF